MQRHDAPLRPAAHRRAALRLPGVAVPAALPRHEGAAAPLELRQVRGEPPGRRGLLLLRLPAARGRGLRRGHGLRRHLGRGAGLGPRRRGPPARRRAGHGALGAKGQRGRAGGRDGLAEQPRDPRARGVPRAALPPARLLALQRRRPPAALHLGLDTDAHNDSRRLHHRPRGAGFPDLLSGDYPPQHVGHPAHRVRAGGQRQRLPGAPLGALEAQRAGAPARAPRAEGPGEAAAGVTPPGGAGGRPEGSCRRLAG
mmetsp:Transcript_23270/g.73251  ORF Transcript_23270/g.73251 Transcript_23270/m.73251 type:complete len:255 (-) Transcript_23270:16-780(-)